MLGKVRVLWGFGDEMGTVLGTAVGLPPLRLQDRDGSRPDLTGVLPPAVTWPICAIIAGGEPGRKWAGSHRTVERYILGVIRSRKIVEMTKGKLSYQFCRSLSFKLYT